MRKALALTSMMALAVIDIGCVATYSSRSVTVGQQDTVTVLPEVATVDADLRDNWRVVMARCFIVRRHMQAERESIIRNNRATGAVFAGLAAAFGAAATIYSAATDQPDRLVTAVLGAGAGISAAPTFAYFGSDIREQDVQTRIATLDRTRAQAVQVSQRLVTEGQAVTSARHSAEAAVTASGTAATALEDAARERAQAQEAFGRATTEQADAERALTAARAGTEANRAATARVAAARQALTDSRTTLDAKTEAWFVARARHESARSTETDRTHDLEGARTTLHASERELETLLQGMSEACQ